jgi:hypothetical protein
VKSQKKKDKSTPCFKKHAIDQDNMKMPLMRFRKSKKNKHDVFGKEMTPSYNVLCKTVIP